MAGTVLVQSGTAKTWRDSGGDYALTFNALASGAAKEGVKGDLGATRAEKWAVQLTVEWSANPTAGGTVDVYWSASPSATAGTENDGKATGADATWPASGTVAGTVPQLIYLGSLTVVAESIVQRATIGIFTPPLRYGIPIIHNNTSQAFKADAVNHKLVLTPNEGYYT